MPTGRDGGSFWAPTNECPWDLWVWREQAGDFSARPKRPAQRGCRPAPAPIHCGGHSGKLKWGPTGLGRGRPAAREAPAVS